MKKSKIDNSLPLFLLAVLCSSVALAAVKSGENMIINGRFECDQGDTPPGWSAWPSGIPMPKAFSEGGPQKGMPFVRLENHGDIKCGEWSYRQNGFSLVEGGTYRLSAWMRSHNLQGGSLSFAVANFGWQKGEGVGLPAGGSEKWVRLEKTIKMFPSRRKGSYFVVFYVSNFKGSVDLADVRFEAIDELACRESKAPVGSRVVTEPRIVPWSPMLGEIPSDTREVEFRFMGRLPEGTADADCEFTLEGDGVSVPLRAKLDRAGNRFTLPPAAKTGTLKAQVRDRRNDRTVVERVCRYRVIDLPRDKATRGRRLNNLVTEILSLTLDGTNGEHSFTLARRGWVVVAVKSAAASLAVTLDDQTVIEGATPRHETFRELAVGHHTLKMAGMNPGDRVLVRTIPEIVNYGPGFQPIVSENGPYDWAFEEKHALPAVTTQLGGGIRKENLASFRARGYHLINNIGTSSITNADDMYARVTKSAGARSAVYDGVSMDEQFYGRDAVNTWYLKGLARADLEMPESRNLYTWAVGSPLNGLLDADFIATTCQAAYGRGMVLFEAYCRTKGSEEAARAYLDFYLGETAARYRKVYPESIRHLGVILGNFTQVPVLSLAHHPEVDYRYFLDMQMNLVANDPRFEGVGGVGYWSGCYLDEESYRWGFMLLRHYCILGRKEMLSDRYGFTYLATSLKNGDFRGSLDGWTATGDVVADIFHGLGEGVQQRWGGANGIGDTFARLTRGKSPNRLEQKATGLEPGRFYSLQFMTFDVNDLKARRVDPKPIALRAELGDGGEICADRSWHHVDRRDPGHYTVRGAGRVRMNLHRIVFKAKAPEVMIRLTDAEAAEGSCLGVNYMSVKPYLR